MNDQINETFIQKKGIKMDEIKKTLDQWVSADGIEFVDALSEQSYRTRARRISDSILLKKPDRVPVIPSFGMFPALDNGITCEEAMFDTGKTKKAWLQTLPARFLFRSPLRLLRASRVGPE